MTENPAVTAFREYLRIRTDQPNPDYNAAVEFLKEQATSRLGLPVEIYGTSENPIVVIKWAGSEPNLAALMLNSHMDVVPVFQDKWSHDPFAAEKTEDGKIYARGSQDMKSQGMQYIEAVLKLKKEGFTPLRNVLITFVPDEENGGHEGMKKFVETDEFKALNVGFAIDESCASPLDLYVVFFDERSNWAVEVSCPGATGHGSAHMKNTAGEKARVVLDEFFDFRKTEGAKLDGKPIPEIELAKITTVNLTIVQGGIQPNVLPDEIKITFDIRVSIDEDHERFYEWIQSVMKKAGEGVEAKFIRREGKGIPTKIDESNKFWVALESSIHKMGADVIAIACPGNTDGRFLRWVSIFA
ncbi:unnamed protein product [Nesidiocoris tenuis]|uniref:N-acyl-aliphatic-L-amino acid amidohydrolase n=1 Tax=Nesidiocoris tenuis TaxID=355587 RepID=A0A6H5H786_9HEMI|nr:unnamed protein product [Nesidiocoris tenuis]